MKSILIRVIVYPFCIIMIHFGIIMINYFHYWDNGFVSGSQLFAGIGMIVIALLFIITDVLIMIRNIRKTKK